MTPKIDQLKNCFRKSATTHQQNKRMSTDQTTSNKTAEGASTPYAIVLVFSAWPLRQLCQFLQEELGATPEDLGVVRIDRLRKRSNDGVYYQETNRTIMLVQRSILNAAEVKGLTAGQRGLDFKMTEYEVREHNLPKEGYTRNFFIPLPKDLSADDVQNQLQNKLDVLCRFEMFSEEEKPRLKIPVESRETGSHRGRAFVTFGRDTPIEVIALARVLLHLTRLYLDEEKHQLMECYWAKERPKRSPRQDNSKPRPGKNKRPAMPSKKGQGKTQTKTEKPKPKPVVVKALPAGENQWKTPLAEGSSPVVPEPSTTETTVAELPALPSLEPTETPVVSDDPVLKPNDFPTLQ